MLMLKSKQFLIGDIVLVKGDLLFIIVSSKDKKG